MFENVGKKLQGLATAIMVVGILVCVAGGLVLVTQVRSLREYGALWFILFAGVGILSTYIMSMFIYAFGELVENIASMEDDTGHFRKCGVKCVDDGSAQLTDNK